MELEEKDLRIDTFRHPTPGPSPCVVRITHIPTGVVVTSEKRESVIQAKAEALQMLREALQSVPADAADHPTASDDTRTPKP